MQHYPQASASRRGCRGTIHRAHSVRHAQLSPCHFLDIVLFGLPRSSDSLPTTSFPHTLHRESFMPISRGILGRFSTLSFFALDVVIFCIGPRVRQWPYPASNKVA